MNEYTLLNKIVLYTTDVYVDGISVADELLKGGYAVRYSGGHKIDWCKK